MGASSTVATVATYQVVKTKEKGYAEYHPQVSVVGLGYVDFPIDNEEYKYNYFTFFLN